MALTDMLLPELDDDMKKTRRVLERVPEDRFSWEPHPKSMSMIRLANHLASLPGFGMRILQEDFFDIGASGGNPPNRTPPATTADLVAAHDGNVAALREILAATDDARWMAPWSIRRNGEILNQQPRIAMFRAMFLNHVIHHRGQLTVYLRLNDIPVPPLFGPSADEAI